MEINNQQWQEAIKLVFEANEAWDIKNNSEKYSV